MVFEDCPICLDEMHPSDHDHPLQCDRRCGYNFCKNCIESLITSSKDDYMEASDGNRHVKVFLHCPNCRSDLSHTIRDTLLLRKADAVIQATDDSELSASQLRLKNVLATPQVKTAIQQARRLEADYLGQEFTDDEDEIEYEEEGFEADLIHGVHQSFRMPKSPALLLQQTAVMADPTLFAGLEYFLTEDERQFVTEQMTSGEPSKLAEAAKILHSVAQMTRDPRQLIAPAALDRPVLVKRSSVFALIEEAQAAKRIPMPPRIMPPGRARAEQVREMQRSLKKHALFQKEFPVPVRMPKCIEIDLRAKWDLELIDDEWNGTVMDAYSKISIGYNGAVTQKRTDNQGVRHILGTDTGDVQIEMPGQKRVLIKYAGREAGRQGAMKGDVVTHIADESIAGKTASAALIMANNFKQRGHYNLTLILNAERSVAEALKRRALAIAET